MTQNKMTKNLHIGQKDSFSRGIPLGGEIWI
ncbi:hypothetical protein ES705_27608 [subsurface metagenome]